MPRTHTMSFEREDARAAEFIDSAVNSFASLTARVAELEAALTAAASMPREYESEYAGRTYYHCTGCGATLSENKPHDADCAWKGIDAALPNGGKSHG